MCVKSITFGDLANTFRRLIARLVPKYFTTAVASLLLVASLGSIVQAQPPATPDAAAMQWLSFLDGGDYDKSWERAGELLKHQFSAHDLQSKFAPLREPLGAIFERKLFAVNLTKTMPGVPDGMYAVLQFNSKFANKSAAVETVVMAKENDRWGAVGYFIK